MGLLVLSRKIGETIYVGTDVSITVVRIGHNAVRLGIKAPRGVTVTMKVNRGVYEVMMRAARDEAKRQLEELGVTEIGF